MLNEKLIKTYLDKGWLLSITENKAEFNLTRQSEYIEDDSFFAEVMKQLDLNGSNELVVEDDEKNDPYPLIMTIQRQVSKNVLYFRERGYNPEFVINFVMQIPDVQPEEVVQVGEKEYAAAEEQVREAPKRKLNSNLTKTKDKKSD